MPALPCPQSSGVWIQFGDRDPIKLLSIQWQWRHDPPIFNPISQDGLPSQPAALIGTMWLSTEQIIHAGEFFRFLFICPPRTISQFVMLSIRVEAHLDRDRDLLPVAVCDFISHGVVQFIESPVEFPNVPPVCLPEPDVIATELTPQSLRELLGEVPEDVNIMFNAEGAYRINPSDN